jgi:hypothetical protein
MLPMTFPRPREAWGPSLPSSNFAPLFSHGTQVEEDWGTVIWYYSIPPTSHILLAYQPPANSTFLSEQTNHQQPIDNTFHLEQISTIHQPPVKRTGWTWPPPPFTHPSLCNSYTKCYVYLAKCMHPNFYLESFPIPKNSKKNSKNTTKSQKHI